MLNYCTNFNVNGGTQADLLIHGFSGWRSNQGRLSYGGTKHDTSWKFKGEKNLGLTNKYTKFGQLTIRKITKTVATRCKAKMHQCTLAEFKGPYF